jgi:hypothetical protein
VQTVDTLAPPRRPVSVSRLGNGKMTRLNFLVIGMLFVSPVYLRAAELIRGLPEGTPAATIDLMKEDGQQQVKGQWRYRSTSGGGTEITFGPKDGILTVGGVKKLVGAGKVIHLRIFLDKRVMEVFVDDGTAAIYTVTDAGPQDLGVETFAVGGTVRLDSLTAWPLRPASFSLEHFKI